MSDKNDRIAHKFIVDEILSRCHDSKYIFRGESKEFSVPMSSGLHRQFCLPSDEKDAPPPITGEYFSVVRVEKDMVEEAKEHATIGTRNIDVLTELQHYGGKTALVDFTYSLHIALFLACDGKFDETGCLYFFKEESFKRKRDIEYTPEEEKIDILIDPTGKHPRVIFQSSVFVHAHRGYLDVKDGNCVGISPDKKLIILDYLKKNFSISTKTIYNDMHGFIKNQHNDFKAKIEFYRGLFSGYSDKHGFTKKQDAYTTAEIEFYRGISTDKKNYSRAEQHYSNAIELNPRFTVAYNNRGIIKTMKGDFNEAIKDYDRAIELNPNFARAYYNRGVAKTKKSDFNEAIKDYNRAIELNPKLVEAYNSRGNVKADKGNFDEAMKDYNKAIELNPRYAEIYNNRGTVKAGKGDIEGAIADFTQAIELNPEYADAYFNRGLAKAGKDDSGGAIADFTRTIELDPQHINAYHNRALAKEIIGDKTGAAEDRRQAEELRKSGKMGDK